MVRCSKKAGSIVSEFPRVIIYRVFCNVTLQANPVNTHSVSDEIERLNFLYSPFHGGLLRFSDQAQSGK